MVRRLQILLADAFFLFAIGVLVVSLLQWRRAGEPDVLTDAMKSTAIVAANTTSMPALPTLRFGEVMVSAWVAVAKGDRLLFPGDEVVLSSLSLEGQPIGPLKVATIEAPSPNQPNRHLMTFTGDRETVDAVRSARHHHRLTVHVHRARMAAGPEGSLLLSDSQIITRRYSDASWNRRMARVAE